MALEPSKHVNGRRWSPGQSGNPNGRPVGSEVPPLMPIPPAQTSARFPFLTRGVQELAYGKDLKGGMVPGLALVPGIVAFAGGLPRMANARHLFERVLDGIKSSLSARLILRGLALLGPNLGQVTSESCAKRRPRSGCEATGDVLWPCDIVCLATRDEARRIAINMAKMPQVLVRRLLMEELREVLQEFYATLAVLLPHLQRHFLDPQIGPYR